MPTIRIPANGWQPRPCQMPAWLAWEKGIKRSLLIWHRRAGKDELSLHKTCIAMHPTAKNNIQNARVANYWHCLPAFEQARKAIWEAVNPHTGKLRIDEVFPKEVRANTRNDMMSITFKSGSVWRVVGSDNPDSLVGAPPFGIVFSEWALSNPSAWGLLQPILLENGGWADFITTPRGKNHVYGMMKMARTNPNWFCQTLTIDDTHQVSLEQIEEAKREYVSLYGQDQADALIQQEYWCSFEAAILGAYYGKELAQAQREDRITLVDADPRYPLHTAWDLGVRDSMVIWFFQVIPGLWGAAKVLVVGCYSATNYGIGHYAEVIHDYRGRVGAPAGTDYVPHDARQREMGAFGEDNLAKQRLEVMLECRLKPKVVANHVLMDGISAVRAVLPRCWFDEEACETGLEGLRQYQTEWDDEAKIFSDRPRHDWASHYADGFRTLAMAYREVEAEAPKPVDRALTIGRVPVKVGDVVYGLPTYDDLARLKDEEPRARKRI